MKRPAAAAAVAPKKPKKDYPTVGTIIEAKWSTEFGPGKEWYRGKIAKVHAGKTSSRDPSFDVAYDDGELEEKVRWENIRVVDPSTPAPVYDYDEPEIVASKTSLEPTRPRSKREIRAPQKGPLASAALSPPPQPKPRPRQPKQRAPLTVRLPKPPPPKPPVPQKESARMVRQLVRTDREKLDLETVRDALRTDPIKDQADHGRVGGMLAGRIGENKYVVEYATDCRAKCKLFSCKRSLFLGELRIGKVPPRVNPLQNKRVHWYHPSCVFQSFRRASKKTKLIDHPEIDLEGWHALQPNDRAFIDLCLRRSREAPGDWALDEDTSSSNAPPEPVDGAAVDLLLSLQAPGAAAAAAPAAPPPADDGLAADLAGRPHAWAFLGRVQNSNRAAMLDAFAQLPGAAFVRAQNSSATWLEARAAALGARASCDALRGAVLAPCPVGNVHPETHRVWEAIECGGARRARATSALVARAGGEDQS